MVKTIQFHNKVVWALIIPAVDPEICPQTWMRRMIRNVPADAQEPLFLVRLDGDRVPLTSRNVGVLLKEWCESAGIDPKPLTGHCLRRGGLTWAHDSKLTGESLKILGDWASTAYLRYIDVDFQDRLKSGHRMAQHAAKKLRVRGKTD